MTPAAQRGENIADVVAAVAAVVVEFHRGRQLERMFSLSVERDHVAALCQTLHTTLDLRRIALDLANEGAAALRVDRVSVLLADESGFKLEAATSVNEIAALLCARLAPGIAPIHVAAHRGELRYSIADINHIATALDYAPSASLDSRIDEVIEFCQSNGTSR